MNAPRLLVTTSLVVTLLAGCAPALTLTPVSLAREGATQRVLILKSSNNALYEGPTRSFVSQFQDSATVYVEVADDERLAAITNLQPHVIFALGTRAATWARANLPEVPMLFSMVLNHKRLKVLESPLVMGVALEVSPAVEFTQFKLAHRNMQRVLVIHSPKNSAQVVGEARETARTMGIEFVEIAVDKPEDVPAAYLSKAKQVDTVWLLNDPVVMNPASFTFLRDACVKDKLALVSSLSGEFARAGAMLSVSVDLSSLGTQAAALAHSMLDNGQTPAQIGVQPPIGARLVLNAGVAKEVGVTIPDELLPFINEIVVTQK